MDNRIPWVKVMVCCSVAELDTITVTVTIVTKIPWCYLCRELTTLWVVRLDDGAELKVTDPKEQQRDVKEEEAEGYKRGDGVDCGR